jgi:hypothetical protein
VRDDLEVEERGGAALLFPRPIDLDCTCLGVDMVSCSALLDVLCQ